VRTCLAKQPRDRWQSAADLRRELEWLAADDEADLGPIPPASRATPLRRRVHVAWTTVAVAGWLVALGALGLVFFRPEMATTGPPQPTLRAEVPAPTPRSAVDRAFHGPVAVSPDGGTVALAARGGDTSVIWITDLATDESRQLTGTEGARAPFWSPDGSALGFFASEKLKRIPREGGVPQTLADAPSGRGAAWSPEGVILFAPNVFGPLWVISEQGGEARPATEAEEGLSHRFPHFLADGRTFVFLRSRVVADHEMALASLDDPVPHGLRANQTAAYPVGNYLLFEDGGQLVAQRLDLGRKALVGGATPLVEDVWADSGMGMADFSASENGVVLWGTDYVQEQRLEWVDTSGRATVRLGRTGRFNVHRLSPDGRRLLVGITEPDTGDVELRILDLGTEELLLASPRLGWAGAWSPDSRRYATVDNETRIVVVDITSGSSTVLATTDGPTEVVDWSSDGDSLLLMQQNLETGAPDIMTIGAHDGAEPQAVLQSTAWDWPSRFSPDGRFVTFLSDRLAPGTGRYQLYATRFPEGGEVRQISADGVTWDPQPDCPWSPDGKFIYWIDPRGKLMRVPVATEGGFRAGSPQEVMAIAGASFLDITRDGRILTMVPTDDQPPPSLHLLVNWTNRLPRPGAR
jgi:Tol biopolymer transport system component